MILSRVCSITALLAIMPLAIAFPRTDLVPGGIAVLDIGAASDGSQAPDARYNGKRVTVTDHEGRWVAVVGIPLTATVGQSSITVHQGKASSRSVAFTISKKDYPEQRITLKDNSKVELSKESLVRVGREQIVIDSYKTTFRDTSHPQLDFIHPTDGPLSSRFGLKRYFNDKPRKPHSGLDYASPAGTPIHAPSGGIVIGAGDFFFNGNSVFVDHGQGIISLFGHMSRLDVTPGQWIEQGDIIGAVGKTGRATGPHLHWTLLLNGTAVDPELFLPPR